ncbi:hypothetical protein [Bacillus phage SPO1L1]|nr:hypothetical protein [Bacillus phage SPO1L1]WIT26103.1 hypothetical protein [Bacillus phage SPO1L2]
MNNDGLQERIELLVKEGYRKDEFGHYVKSLSEGNSHIVDRLHLTEISEYPDLDTLDMYIKYKEDHMRGRLRTSVYNHTLKMNPVPSLQALIGIEEIDVLSLFRRSWLDFQIQHRTDFIVGDLSEVSGRPYYVALKNKSGKPLEILPKEGVQYYQGMSNTTIIIGPVEMKRQLENMYGRRFN